MRFVLVSAFVLLGVVPGWAQFKTEVDPKGPQLGSQLTQKLKVGFTVKAAGRPCMGIVATVPVPMDWPEQLVRVDKEDTSPAVKSVHYRSMGPNLRIMTVEIPQLPAGQTANAFVTFDVTRSTLKAPTDTSIYKIPKKVDRQTLIFLGPSPYIESRHPKIVSQAKEVIADKETAWQQVEAIYDWVRENIALKTGDLKGAARALHDKDGDRDERCCLFVAMCRAAKIPARTVFVPDHVYAEFYLVDDENQGHWFPCELSASRNFGGIDDLHPIVQKGDSFKNPENPRQRQRLMTEYLEANSGSSPKVKFVRELLTE